MFKAALIIIAASAVAVLYLKPPLPAKHVESTTATLHQSTPADAVVVASPPPSIPVMGGGKNTTAAEALELPTITAEPKRELTKEQLLGRWAYRMFVDEGRPDRRKMVMTGVIAFYPDGHFTDEITINCYVGEATTHFAWVKHHLRGKYGIVKSNGASSIIIGSIEITTESGKNIPIEAQKNDAKYWAQDNVFRVLKIRDREIDLDRTGEFFTLQKSARL